MNYVVMTKGQIKKLEKDKRFRKMRKPKIEHTFTVERIHHFFECLAGKKGNIETTKKILGVK